jgi:succinoglycan biosynthesis transport protein ExoP
MPHERIGKHLELERGARGSYVQALVTRDTVPQAVQASGDSIGLNEVTGSLWRRKMTIAAAAILGVCIGQAVNLLTTPIYRARASLQIEGFNGDQFLREVSPVSLSLPNATPENYLQNEVKLLQSETLARRVADKLETTTEDKPRGVGPVSALKERFKNKLSFLRHPQLTAAEQRIRAVQKALDVRTSLQSQVVEVLYDAPDPNLAASGANLVTAEFVNLNREARWQLAQDTTDWLNKQAADLKATLEGSNQRLQNFARSAGLVFAGKQSTLDEDRMRQIQSALAKAEEDRAAKQARYETALTNPDSLTSDALSSGPLKQYQESLQNLRRELAQLQTMYTSSNYKVERVQAQLAETEKSIANERKAAVGRLRTEYLAAAGLERLLSEEHALQLNTVEQQMEKERRYDARKSEIDATQRLYESMLQKVKEAGAASALRTTNVRVIDSASPPTIPYSPNPPLNMAIGLAFGALGGIGFVLVREGSQKVRRPGESVLLDVPELGVIPAAQGARALDFAGRRLRGSRGRIQELGLTACDQDTSVLAESFRAALTSILFGSGLHNYPGAKQPAGQVLVVTSIDVKEGKTTVLSNLGVAAAERKQRVLVIDADLRRPRLHEMVDLPNNWGLVDVLQCSDLAELAENSSLEALVRPTRIPGLCALPSGRVDGASHGLLYSSDLGSLLQRFRREFDLVLIDTPPMMLYSDVRLLGRMSDGVVMVIRANTKRRDELKEAYLRFMHDRIPVLGTILNDWKMDPSQTRAYGRYQKHYSARLA